MPSICDVNGILVGSAEDQTALTGCTVILTGKDGATCGVDVRGSGPGTRETDLLNPINMVEKVHAIVLSGGSAFGLDTACGVMDFLEERGIGFNVGPTVVPIVPAAVLFDLLIGDYKVRPDRHMGYLACENAGTLVKEGNYGAGTGASVGKIRGHQNCTKSGQGTYSITLKNGLTVGAIVAVNAFGDILDPKNSNNIIAGVRDDEGNIIGTNQAWREMADLNIRQSGLNTTIAVVASNAKLDKTKLTKVAQMAHNGLARVINPVHTMCDGDTVFALGTGEIEADVNVVGYLAQEVLAEAIIRAIETASTVGTVKSYKD